MKKNKAAAIICICLGLAGMPLSTFASEKAELSEPYETERPVNELIVSGSWYGIDWSLDQEGTLTLTGNGMNYGEKKPEWLQYADRIRQAKLSGTGMKSAKNLFFGCKYLTAVDTGQWDSSQVITMSGMFEGCVSLAELNVQEWDTANVYDMSRMFWDCGALKNLAAGKWNTGSAANMNGMFWNCVSLETLDVGGWDTKQVTDMTQMFSGCSHLTGLDVGGWSVDKVSGMTWMFRGCESLRSLDVSGWNPVSAVTMYGMFGDCKKLERLDVSGWDVGSVKVMESMFEGCGELAVLDVGNWNTANVSNMKSQFANCTKLTVLDVSGWDTGNVGNTSRMFFNGGFESLDVEDWNTGKLTEMGGMFSGCQNLISLNTGKWDVSNVVNASGAFQNCKNLERLATEEWDTGMFTDIEHMFADCEKLSARICFSGSEIKRFEGCFLGAATAPESKIIVSYGGDGTKEQAQALVATKSAGAFVYLQGEEPAAEPVRIAGTSRYQTAIACAEQMRGDGTFPSVVLACADNFPDALAGSPLAASVHAPILLVGKSETGTKETLDYIISHVDKNGKVYLLGGVSAVPESVAVSLRESGFSDQKIKRLGGGSRYETNLFIVNEMTVTKGTDIVIVSGTGYADSLSVSGIAGARGMPIFLAGEILTREEVKKIEEIAPKHIYLIGGTGAVSDKVKEQADSICSSVVRIAGATRYETSLKVAEYFGMAEAEAAVFAYGGNFPDGLTGGAFAAALNAPVILVSDGNYTSQEAFLQRSNITTTFIMGGTSVISDETMKHLKRSGHRIEIN